MSRLAAFLDKDGTLVVDVPYNADPERVELAPGAGAAVRELNDAGFLVLVVSNQSGLARGRFTRDQLDAATDRLVELLDREGATVDGWYWCPHHPAGTVPGLSVACSCRKPQPGLLLRAAAEHDVDLRRSWMVGDILDDVEAGSRAGVRTVLVDVGSETEWVDGPLRVPEATCASLLEAARHVVEHGVVAASGPESTVEAAMRA